MQSALVWHSRYSVGACGLDCFWICVRVWRITQSWYLLVVRDEDPDIEDPADPLWVFLEAFVCTNTTNLSPVSMGSFTH